MSVALRLAAATFVGLAVAGCAGDPSDESEIDELVHSFFASLAEGDAQAAVDLMSDECAPIKARYEEELQAFLELAPMVRFDVSEIEKTPVSDGSFDVRPRGTVILPDGPQPLFSEGGEFTRVAKENGEWKFVDCEFFGEAE